MIDATSPLKHTHLDVSGQYNNTFAQSSDSDLFFACWRLQNCEDCLSSPRPCSWCSVSQACVPNTRAPFPFQILAPIKYSDICPGAWRERWEMRAKPFSCRCSSMTLISVVVAVLSTLFGVLLIWLFVKFVRWVVRRWRTRDSEWWKRWRDRVTMKRRAHDEHQPLLSAD